MSCTPKGSPIRRTVEELRILLRSIPSTVVTLFVVSVISMNLLANKTLLQLDFIALDAGILISWLSFMCMDVITKHFGPRASTLISVNAALINLLTCLIFYIASILPSNAGSFAAFDGIFGGTWFILLSSTIAFLLSAGINNGLNALVGRLFKQNPHGRVAYMTRAYVSTLVSQFFDNLIFSLLVFRLFAPIFWNGFSWTVLQCTTCALVGALAELLMEAIFSPIGYRICRSWQESGVGNAYFQFIGKETDV